MVNGHPVHKSRSVNTHFLPNRSRTVSDTCRIAHFPFIWRPTSVTALDERFLNRYRQRGLQVDLNSIVHAVDYKDERYVIMALRQIEAPFELRA